MCKEINFNVIEKNKYDNTDDIAKSITNIVNSFIDYIEIGEKKQEN